MAAKQRKKSSSPAVPGAEILGHSGRDGDHPRVKTYDFRRPDKFSKDQVRTVAIMHQTYAHLSATRLSGFLEADVSVTQTGVDQMTFSELQHQLGPGLHVVNSVAPLRGTTLWHLSEDLAAALVDRAAGAVEPQERPQPSAEIDGGQAAFGRLALTVARQLAAQLVSPMREAWAQLEAITVEVTAVLTDPKFAMIVPPSEMVLAVTFDVKLAGAEGPLTLCLPYLTLEPLTKKLHARWWYSSVRRSGAAKALGSGPVDALALPTVVALGGPRMTIGSLAALQIGDEVSLPQPPSAQLVVGGEPLVDLEAPVFADDGSVSFPVRRQDSRRPGQPREGSEAGHVTQQVEGIAAQVADLTRQQRELQSLVSRLGFEEPPPVRRDELRVADTDAIYRLLEDERPQIVAVVLSLVPSDVAAALLRHLHGDRVSDVASRVVRLTPIAVDVAQALQQELADYAHANPRFSAVYGGVERMVEILELAPSGLERSLVASLEQHDAALAHAIKQRLFVFEDIAVLTQRSLQQLIEAAEWDDLVMAVRGAQEPVLQALQGALSPDRVGALQSAIAAGAPGSPAEIEAARRRIVAVAGALEATGALAVRRSGPHAPAH